MEILQLLSGLTTRLIFLIHSILCFYILHHNRSNATTGSNLHWLIMIPILGLLMESAMMILCRHTEKWNFHYVWPAGLFYISSIVPAIVVVELQLFEQRLELFNQDSASNTSSLPWSAQDMSITPVWGLTDEVFVRKFCELGLFLGLLIGRWLTPRGNLTREQLSSLMLGYVCTISDILEVLEAFDLPTVMYVCSVNTAVILLFTLATYQFSLITVINNKDDDFTKQNSQSESPTPHCPKAFKHKVHPLEFQYSTTSSKSKMAQLKAAYIEHIKERERKKTESRQRGKGVKRISTLKRILSKAEQLKAQRLQSEQIERRRLHKEIFQILVTIFMQDGPFLIIRLYVIIVYGVDSEMHLFFTCKNIITIILLVNRILILTCHEDKTVAEVEDSSFKLYHVQQLRDDIWNPKEDLKREVKPIV